MDVKRVKVGWRKTKPARADGMVYAQLHWTEEGRTRTETVGWTTPAGADLAVERKAAALFLESQGVRLIESQPEPTAPSLALLVADYADDLEERGAGGDGYRTNVINRSAYLTRHLGKLSVDRLTLRDLEGYVTTRRKEMGGRRGNRPPKRVTVQDELRLLKRVVETTGRWGRHDARWPGMPAFKGWPKDARPARKLTAGEHQKLVDTAAADRPELARLLEFMGWCPRRPVAIFDLRREDCVRALDPSYQGRDLAFFRRDKGGEGVGWGPLLPEARAALVAHLHGTIGPADEVVWKPAMGGQYKAQTLGRVLDYLSTKAKIPLVTPYDLRKLAAVRAYHACAGKLKPTCAFTGHADGATLYRHYLFEEEDVVMAAVRGERVGE